MKNKKIKYALGVIEGVERDHKFKNDNEIDKKEQLTIGGSRYAGVFELRYLQNIGYLQNQWLNIWKAYLDSDSFKLPARTNIGNTTQGIATRGKNEMENKLGLIFRKRQDEDESKQKITKKADPKA